MEIEDKDSLTRLSTYKGKNVLITGHTGFKGSWLTIWLSQLGARVSGIALPPVSEKDNYVLCGLSGKVENEFMQDIRDAVALNSIFDKIQPEIVFHLAAQALVLESYQNPVETFETNIMGTVNVLEACRKSPSVKTIVVITSDKCYENKEWVWPYRENDPMGGYDPYSSSKGAVELVAASYRNSFFNPAKYKEHGKSLSTVRAGNVIGGGDWSENRIVPDCIKSIESNSIIEVRNPNATRPWQHVLEPLGGYLLIAEKIGIDPVNFAEAWNFGPKSDSIINVGRLVTEIIHAYGRGSWHDASQGNAAHEANLLSLDISKARNRLGWSPVLTFEETVKLTVDWYTKYGSSDVFELCNDQIASYMKRFNKLNF